MLVSCAPNCSHGLGVHLEDLDMVIHVLKEQLGGLLSLGRSTGRRLIWYWGFLRWRHGIPSPSVSGVRQEDEAAALFPEYLIQERVLTA